MDNKKHKAQLILFQIAAINEGNFDQGSTRLLTLINETLKDAKELAEDTLKEERESEKKAA